MRSVYGRASGVKRLETFWTPSRLFTASEVGVWFDPSDSTTVWQDSARTTPALKDDPVGAIDDKSGNDDHALQTTADSRPMLRQTAGGHWYLEFDGVDDFLRVAFTVAQPIERISAFRQITWTTSDRIYGAVASPNTLLIQNNATPEMVMYSGLAAPVNSEATIGVDVVVTERHDGASSRLAVNNAAYVTGNTGTGVGGGITIGATAGGSFSCNFWLYGIGMGSFGGLSDTDIQLARNFMAAKAGIIL